jgi:hypothetical protein
MIDATSGSVVNDRPAGTTKLMIKEDAGRKCEQSRKDAHHEVPGSARPVTLQVEEILARPEDRLDALPDGGEMRTSGLFICPSWPGDSTAQLFDLASEVPARIALVADDGLPTMKGSGQHMQGDFPFRPVGRGQLDRPRGAVRGTGQVQSAAPEPAGVAAAVAIPADISQGRAPHGLHRTGALHWGRVKEQEVVFSPGTLRTEDAEQPLDGLGKTGAALVISVLGGKAGEEMAELAFSSPKKTPVRRDAHEHLGDGQGDDLGIGGLPSSVSASLWQKIIGRAINDGAEGVQVGVHRGLQADGVSSTVDFGPSASLPFCSVMFVASII